MNLLRDKNWIDPSLPTTPPKPKPTISEVAARLRQSKHEHLAAMAAMGRTEGERWANEFAGFDELRRVAALACARDWPPQDLDGVYVMGCATVGGESTIRTFFNLLPDGDERLYDDRDFLAAFVAGAGDVWRQAEPLL